jgi:hypothetical protein
LNLLAARIGFEPDAVQMIAVQEDRRRIRPRPDPPDIRMDIFRPGGIGGIERVLIGEPAVIAGLFVERIVPNRISTSGPR